MKIRFFLFVILYFYTTPTLLAQGAYTYNHPFDSIGVFKEKVSISLPWPPKIGSLSDRKGNRRPVYSDSSDIKKLDYIADLLQKDQRRVLIVLLYDDFILSGGGGWNPRYDQAKRILNDLIRRKKVYDSRIEFYYPTYRNRDKHKALHSTDRRLEFLVYELPE